MSLEDLWDKGTEALGNGVEKAEKAYEKASGRFEEAVNEKYINKVFNGLEDGINKVVGGEYRSPLQVAYDNLFNDEKKTVDGWDKFEKNEQIYKNKKLSKRVRKYLEEYLATFTDEDKMYVKCSAEERKFLDLYFAIRDEKTSPCQSTTKNETLAASIFEYEKSHTERTDTFLSFATNEFSHFDEFEKAFGKLNADDRSWVVQYESSAWADRTCTLMEVDYEYHYKRIIDSFIEKLNDKTISASLRNYLIKRKETIKEAIFTIDAEKAYPTDSILMEETVLKSLYDDTEYEHKSYKNKIKFDLRMKVASGIQKNKDLKIAGFPQSWPSEVNGVLTVLGKLNKDQFDEKIACTNLAKDLLSRLETSNVKVEENISDLKKQFHNECLKSFVSSTSFVDFKPEDHYGFIKTVKLFSKYQKAKKANPSKQRLQIVKNTVPEFYDEIEKTAKEENKNTSKAFVRNFRGAVISTIITILCIIFVIVFLNRNKIADSAKEKARTKVYQKIEQEQNVRSKAMKKMQSENSGEKLEEENLPADKQLNAKDIKIASKEFTIGNELSSYIKMGDGDFIIQVNPNTYDVIYTFEVVALKDINYTPSGNLLIGDFVFKDFAVGSNDYETSTMMGDVCESFKSQLKSMRKDEAKMITLTIENPDVWNLYNPKSRTEKERKAFVKKYTKLKNKFLNLK